MISVLAVALSMPLSTMVVAMSTSIFLVANSIITSSTSRGLILPCATPTRASGAASCTRATASSMVLTRLDT